MARFCSCRWRGSAHSAHWAGQHASQVRAENFLAAPSLAAREGVAAISCGGRQEGQWSGSSCSCSCSVRRRQVWRHPCELPACVRDRPLANASVLSETCCCCCCSSIGGVGKAALAAAVRAAGSQPPASGRSLSRSCRAHTWCRHGFPAQKPGKLSSCVGGLSFAFGRRAANSVAGQRRNGIEAALKLAVLPFRRRSIS